MEHLFEPHVATNVFAKSSLLRQEEYYSQGRCALRHLTVFKYKKRLTPYLKTKNPAKNEEKIAAFHEQIANSTGKEYHYFNG